ncbi:MAG TPA: S53 family peptidase [Bryobacteraceae bacterium]|nr:S53 family peptidase [Bryobacteraceae bacterium]
MQRIYGFNQVPNQGQGQVIAIVDAYDDPNAEADLGVFTQQFNLPPCTTANGCFQKIYAAGTPPPVDSNWALEISLDVQWAHAIAPQAKILLVEGASATDVELYRAVDVAVQNGAHVVSMSWGGTEYLGQLLADAHFNVKGVTFVASSGDFGNFGGVSYPATSPLVVGVGGTTLVLGQIGNYLYETAWSDSTGGLSLFETEPSYQASAQQFGKRGTPDVAYNGDPATGVAVYDSVPISGAYGWYQVGGTSAGAPQWSALFAIANSVRVSAGKNTLDKPQFGMYLAPSLYHDIILGTNGECGYICNARAGYDFVTGLGSPRANQMIPFLVSLP